MARRAGCFVSYAERDARAAQALLEALGRHLAASKRVAYRVWEFHALLLGERWHERIQDEIARSDFGLLLLSPAFLTSAYIGAHELPRFVGRGDGVKPIVPVGLKPVDFERHDLKGLEAHQVFRLDGRFFAELPSSRRDAFAFALFQQIDDRVARGLAGGVRA